MATPPIAVDGTNSSTTSVVTGDVSTNDTFDNTVDTSFFKYKNNMVSPHEDTNVSDIMQDYPNIMVGENTQLATPYDRFAKYVIQSQAYTMPAMEYLQINYPGSLYMRQFNCEYLDYEDGGDPEFNQGHGPAYGHDENPSGSTQGGVFAGHWAYQPKTTITSYRGAAATQIFVANSSVLQANNYACLYNGNFENAEHVYITRIVSATEIEVTRNFTKSTAVAHANGSFIAMHVMGQRPTYPENWMYNLSTVCPQDFNGNRFIDWIAEWLVSNKSKTNKAVVTSVITHGIAIDIDFKYSFTSKNLSAYNSNSADYGMSSTGVNVWSNGIDEMYQNIKTLLPDHYVYGGIYESPGEEGKSHGLQLEGWPVDNGTFHNVTPVYNELSGIFSTYDIRHAEHIKPQLMHCLLKTPTKQYPNDTAASSNAPFRLAFTLSLMGDGVFGQQNKATNRDVWYDEYSVNVTPGSPDYGKATNVAVDTVETIMEHKYWLGKPLGNYRRLFDPVAFSEANALRYDSFDNGIITGWTSADTNKNTVAPDSNTFMEGNGSLVGSEQINFSNSMWATRIKGPSITLPSAGAYTISFAAKADIVKDIRAYLGFSNHDVPFRVTRTWNYFTWEANITATTFNPFFAYGIDQSRLWIDEFKIFQGHSNIMRRDFKNGCAIANATSSPQTIDLGGTWQKVLGTQEPTLNNGNTVTSVTIPAYDGIILVRPE